MTEKEAIRQTLIMTEKARYSELTDSEFKDWLDDLFEEGLIDEREVEKVLDSFKNRRYRTSSNNSKLLSVLLSCASLLATESYGESKVKDKEDRTPMVERAITNDSVVESSVHFIKKMEGKVTGDVIVDGKELKDVHVVYDDKNGQSKITKWDGRQETLQAFLKNCTGKPTLGYGLTNSRIVSRGYLTEDEALDYMRSYLSRLLLQVKTKVGEDVWERLTLRQRVALMSLYYNTGIGLNNPKCLSALRGLVMTNKKDDFKKYLNQFHSEFVDCNKSGGKTNRGLTNRREHEYKFFIYDIK